MPSKYIQQWYITLESSTHTQKPDVEMGGGPKYAQPEFDDELIGDAQKENYQT